MASAHEPDFIDVLSAHNAQSPSAGDPGPAIGDRLTDIDRNQDEVRSDVARWLVLTLVGVIVFYLLVGAIAASNCGHAGDCKQVADSLAIIREFLGVALASITGLVGAVTGFYFGAQAAKKR